MVVGKEQPRAAPSTLYGTNVEERVRRAVDGRSHFLTMLGTLTPVLARELYRVTVRVLRKFSRLSYSRSG